MKPTREMSADDLIAEMEQRKIKAFDSAWRIRDWNEEQLSCAGFKHWSDPIMFAGKMNDARMKDWEKDHTA